MIVVSDTTPLNYLLLIGAVDVLPRLFAEVYAPPTVLRELSHTRTPAIVQTWVMSPPSWLRVVEPVVRLPSTLGLDAGEADAISLAKERGIADVLIDEYQGRKIAVAEGLYVLPTLAILERAAERELVDLPTVLAELRGTTYRVRPELIEAALKRDAERKRLTS